MATLLSAEVFKHLYKDTVVSIAEKIEFDNGKTNKTKGTISFIGDNKKHIVFLLNPGKGEIIPEEWKKTLQKLLAACKLNLEDIAFVNFEDQEVSFIEIKEQLKAETVLLFGLNSTAINLPFSIPDFQIQEYDNCKYMQAPEATLSTDASTAIKQQKQQLWEKLKELFLNE